MQSVEATLVVNVVLTNVLLDEGNLTVGVPVSVDSEFTNIVTTLSLNLAIENIQIINGHLMFSSIIMVLTFPCSVCTGHAERTSELLKSPCTTDFLTLNHAIVHNKMLS